MPINPRNLERAMGTGRQERKQSHPLWCDAYQSLIATGSVLWDLIEKADVAGVRPEHVPLLKRTVNSVKKMAKTLGMEYDYHCPQGRGAKVKQRTAREFMYHHAHGLLEDMMQIAESDLIESELSEISYDPEVRIGEYLKDLINEGKIDPETSLLVVDALKGSRHDFSDTMQDAFAELHDEIAAEAEKLIAAFSEVYTASANDYAHSLGLPDNEAEDIYQLLMEEGGIEDFCMSHAGMGAGATDYDRHPWDELEERGVSFRDFEKVVNAHQPKYTQPLFDDANMLGYIAVPRFLELVAEQVGGEEEYEDEE